MNCQKSKTKRHTESPPGQFKKPDGWLKNLHINIVGPLPVANDHQYIHTIIDRFTRWPVAILLRDISAATISKRILRQWITVFDCPSMGTNYNWYHYYQHIPQLFQLSGKVHVFAHIFAFFHFHSLKRLEQIFFFFFISLSNNRSGLLAMITWSICRWKLFFFILFCFFIFVFYNYYFTPWKIFTQVFIGNVVYWPLTKPSIRDAPV